MDIKRRILKYKYEKTNMKKDMSYNKTKILTYNKYNNINTFL